MKPVALMLMAGAVVAAAAKPTVYLIRHGEKPADDDNHELSPEGVQRAQCLRSVFGAGSEYNIGHIMAETPKDSGARQRPYDTVKPLADDLGMDVDISCGKEDEKCVEDVVDNYDGPGNILICWAHSRLNNIAEELGVDDLDNYPDDRFDLIWVDPYPYDEITDIVSENCPGLD